MPEQKTCVKKQLNLKDSVPESFIKGTISEFINWYDDSNGEFSPYAAGFF